MGEAVSTCGRLLYSISQSVGAPKAGDKVVENVVVTAPKHDLSLLAIKASQYRPFAM